MQRYKLTIEYDGGPYVGWQMQDNGISVQQQLAIALKKLSGEDFVPKGAGRTDAGVHALGQVAHIDLETEWETDKIRDGMNFHLKSDLIVVLSAEAVPEEFDSRFSAIKRHYRYVILNRRPRPTFDKGLLWHVPRPLDETLMAKAAEDFIGLHDFSTFRSVHCQAKSPVKTIDSFEVMREKQRVIINCSARSFMHNQVRSMVGSLVEIGMGKWDVGQISEALLAKDRAACGQVAPACGLYFVAVDYD